MYLYSGYSLKICGAQIQKNYLPAPLTHREPKKSPSQVKVKRTVYLLTFVTNKPYCTFMRIKKRTIWRLLLVFLLQARFQKHFQINFLCFTKDGSI
jgi:hypothetical protein